MRETYGGWCKLLNLPPVVHFGPPCPFLVLPAGCLRRNQNATIACLIDKELGSPHGQSANDLVPGSRRQVILRLANDLASLYPTGSEVARRLDVTRPTVPS